MSVVLAQNLSLPFCRGSRDECRISRTRDFCRSDVEGLCLAKKILKKDLFNVDDTWSKKRKEI